MASYLRAMSTKPTSGGSADGSANDLGKRLAKWALIIGVPTAVCVAAYLYYRQQEKTKRNASRRPTTLPNIAGSESPTKNKAGGDRTTVPETRTKVNQR